MPLSQSKPHKGKIVIRYKIPGTEGLDRHLGYSYGVFFISHPEFKGKTGWTSPVVKEEGDEIETINSRYTIVRE